MTCGVPRVVVRRHSVAHYEVIPAWPLVAARDANADSRCPIRSAVLARRDGRDADEDHPETGERRTLQLGHGYAFISFVAVPTEIAWIAAARPGGLVTGDG